jgi:hypothetical protein
MVPRRRRRACLRRPPAAGTSAQPAPATFLRECDEPCVRISSTQIRYLAWHQLRILRLRAEAGPLAAHMVNTARDHTDAGVRFLTFLAERGHTLGQLDQADIDDWFSTASNPHAARDFIVFARARRRCAAVVIPEPPRRSAPGASPQRLAAIVRRLLDDDTIELSDRVAGLLVVLLASPSPASVPLRSDRSTATAPPWRETSEPMLLPSPPRSPTSCAGSWPNDRPPLDPTSSPAVGPATTSPRRG